jgi:hypothetical protein
VPDRAATASAETREQLGVAVWGASPGDEGAARFTGYDAHGKPVVTVVRNDTMADAKHLSMAVEVSGDIGRGRYRLDLAETIAEDADERTFELEVAEDTVTESPSATKVLERLEADFSGELTGEGPTSLVKSALVSETSGLLDRKCVELVTGCAKNLLKYGKDVLPCLKSLNNARKLIMHCPLTAPAGPIVVGVCAVYYGVKTYKEGEKCVENVIKLYENWSERTNDTKEACSGLRSTCTK